MEEARMRDACKREVCVGSILGQAHYFSPQLRPIFVGKVLRSGDIGVDRVAGRGAAQTFYAQSSTIVCPEAYVSRVVSLGEGRDNIRPGRYSKLFAGVDLRWSALQQRCRLVQRRIDGSFWQHLRCA